MWDLQYERNGSRLTQNGIYQKMQGNLNIFLVPKYIYKLMFYMNPNEYFGYKLTMTSE